PGTGSAFSDKANTVTLNLSQEVFQGTAEYRALKYASYLPKIASENLKRLDLNYLSSFGRLISNWIRQTRDLNSLNGQLEVVNRLAKNIKERIRIGRSKKADLLNLNAQISSLRAQIVETKLNLIHLERNVKVATAKETLEIDVGGIEIPKAKQLNISEHPRIKYYQLLLDAEEQLVGVEKGGYFPSLNLDGNYFLNRTGNLLESRWNVTLSGTWEFYSGGQTQQSVKQAKLGLMMAKERLLYEKRKISRERNELINAQPLNEALLRSAREAIKNANLNFKELERELGLGLVDEIIVLRALEDVLRLERNYHRFQESVFNSKIDLSVNMGGLSL
ncbi:MAG: TolC family protein, partial [Bdellovibrionales bacterium]